MKHIKLLGLSLIVVLGFGLTSYAQPFVVPSGTLTSGSSQLVFWYDSAEEDGESDLNDRETFIQITNTSVEPVNIHVQIFASGCADFDDEGTCRTNGPGSEAVVLCVEHDFNDFLTGRDTHVYDMDDPERNDPSNPGDVGIDLENTLGFVVITPVDAPGTRNAIAFQHLFGHSLIINQDFDDDDFETAYRVRAMGRDAVSFPGGSPLADGTVLNGSDNGYVVVQPQLLSFNWQDIPGGPEFSDLVSITFSDNYAGVFGYVAVPGTVTWTPLFFDEHEQPISCTKTDHDCFSDIGLADEVKSASILLGERELCPAIDKEGFGWVKMAISGLDTFESTFGAIGYMFDPQFGGDLDEFFGGANWMIAAGPTTPVVPPDEVCDSGADEDGDGLIDCADPDCAADPACVETDCADGADNDGDGLTDCADPDCAADPACVETGECDDDVDNDGDGLTDCADPDCAADPVCEAEVDGGGGGCAIASTASAGTAAANALVVLIPLLGIGLRSMLRRREEY
ncbi:MAG: hypothetical protein IH874_02740 [Candidatus Dadabacteria bacterium]|nr:hypothetical protein [Candidatus Dadabacteria bacterium]